MYYFIKKQKRGKTMKVTGISNYSNANATYANRAKKLNATTKQCSNDVISFEGKGERKTPNSDITRRAAMVMLATILAGGSTVGANNINAEAKTKKPSVEKNIESPKITPRYPDYNYITKLSNQIEHNKEQIAINNEIIDYLQNEAEEAGADIIRISSLTGGEIQNPYKEYLATKEASNNLGCDICDEFFFEERLREIDETEVEYDDSLSDEELQAAKEEFEARKEEEKAKITKEYEERLLAKEEKEFELNEKLDKQYKEAKLEADAIIEELTAENKSLKAKNKKLKAKINKQYKK